MLLVRIQLVRGLLMSVRVLRKQNCLAYYKYVLNTGGRLIRS